MFLYMMAFMLTSVVEEAFFVDKACRVNLNFSDIICSNITNSQYKEYNKQVQVSFNLSNAKQNKKLLVCNMLTACILRIHQNQINWVAVVQLVQGPSVSYNTTFFLAEERFK
jgi:hypothetical protein